MATDMTRGKPLRLMVHFALPLMLSALLQQVYTLCDSMIVGQLLGTEAFAAIGSCSYLHWFPLSMIFGGCQGFGVVLSQRFGAKDEPGFRRAFAMSALLATALGVLISLIGLLFMTPFLNLLHTPPELMAYTAAYLRVMWLGLALTALYNVLATVLRAAGDSRTPFVALLFSTALNIALDYLLLLGLHMGVTGAALATLIAQAAALLYCAARMRRMPACVPAGPDWRPHGPTMRELIRLGFPILLSNAVCSTGELAVQAAFNACGVTFVTGIIAAKRYYQMLNIVGNGLEGAVATYVGQNAGAKQSARILEGVRTAARLGVASALTIAALAILFARPLILLFLPQGTEEMLRIGVWALRIDAVFVVSLYMLCMHRAAIQGMGNAVVPMLSGFLELAMRLSCVWLLAPLVGRAGLFFTDAASWAVTGAMLVGYYHHMARKLRREMNEAKET